MPDHRERFQQWRSGVGEPTRYLIDVVLERIVPEFQARRFAWYDDYAGCDPNEIAAYTIPLQRRDGEEWPTAELEFDRRGKPTFGITFGSLPPICRRLGEPTPRTRSSVVYAPAYFLLCKGQHRNFDCRFGYRWFGVMPHRRLDAEVATALNLLPELFDLLARGIPKEWLHHEFGYVSEHVLLLGSWHLTERRLGRRADDRRS